MARKIFIDVGGHEGQTVKSALDPSLAFDEVHCFEPHPKYAALIREIKDQRLRVHEAALHSRDGTLRLAGNNTHGGATVLEVAVSDAMTVKGVDVATFVNSFDADDTLFIKMNCEGGEVAIVERLSDVRIKPRLISLAVDFDIVKARWGYWTKRRTVKRARQAGLPIALYETVMVKHAGGVANWLDHFPEHFPGRGRRLPVAQPLKRRMRYALRDLRSALGLTVSWRH